MKNLSILYILLFIFSGCSKDPELSGDMLGGGIVFDPSLYNPEEYLLSYAIPNPTPEQASQPVIILSHGYSATTFEWEEFRNFIEASEEEVLLSRILLGGHGGNYENFKSSTWKDWQSSITEEYSRLVEAGYTNISLLGSSTSGALFLELLAGDFFKANPPRQILLIDPIVIPSNKTLSLVNVLGPMLGYIEVDQSLEEDQYSYHYRPEETLRELQKLLNIVRKSLEDGITLPQKSSLKVYKSKKDPTADPVSAVLIYKGIKGNSGEKIDLEMVDSDLHVYTNLNFRNFSSKDKANQLATFQDILMRVLEEQQ